MSGDLLHMLLLEMCEVKVEALQVVAALEEVSLAIIVIVIVTIVVIDGQTDLVLVLP